MKAKDLMTTPVAVIRDETDLDEVVRMFDEEGVGHVLVTDAAGRTIGLITADDLEGYENWRTSFLSRQKAWKTA